MTDSVRDHSPPGRSGDAVLTGLGPITAFGVGIAPLWEAMLAGRSAIRPIRDWDASGFASSAAAEIAPELYDVRATVPKSYRKATKVMARDIELAVGAAAEAIRDAGLVTRGTAEGANPSIAPDRMGCHIGAGLIAAEVDELTAALVTSRGPDGRFDIGHWGQAGMQNLTPLWLLKYLPNMLSCHVTIIHDCQGPSNTITCAEASSGLSIGESMRVIERGDADACLSGGAEARIHPMGILRQTFARRLAPTPAGVDPATVVRPFAPDASGAILGEGGGIVVVENPASAAARGIPPIAVLAGFGASQSFCPDTCGTEIDSTGRDIAAAVERAIGQAKIAPDAIDAIVPFGSGIAAFDRAETAALTSVFGQRAKRIPIIQTVPFVGNCGAGCGAIALCVAAQALRTQTLPARINTSGCTALDANAAPSRPAALGHVLVLSTSLGGQTAAVVLRRA
jgi:3-oxoacyl-[acyl-carrier-protein] synthase II